MDCHSRHEALPALRTLLRSQALVVLLSPLVSASDGPVALSPDRSYANLTSLSLITSIKSLLQQLFPAADSPNTSTWVVVGMVELTVVCGIGSALYLWRKHRVKNEPASLKEKKAQANRKDAVATDPGLLKKHSSFRNYDVPATGFSYPAIRTFYRPHSQEGKLPQKPCPIPLLVFIHGLGGSIAQFHAILSSLINLAPTLAIDLPGCGLSTFAPREWQAYSTKALVHLLAKVIEAHRDHEAGQGIVLIGHSMGCSLAALLASTTSPFAHLVSEHVCGVVVICPQAEPLDDKHAKALKTATSVPAPLFDLFRRWDRRGGLNSKSVVRMTSADAAKDTKKLQLRYNEQSRTPVWQRMAYGMIEGLPGKEVWCGLEMPVFILGGEADKVTPADNVRILVKFLGRDESAVDPPSEKASLPIAAAPVDPAILDPALPHQKAGSTHETVTAVSPSLAGQTVVESESNELTLNISTEPLPDPSSPSPHPRRLLVKTTILPAPAAHSLLFDPSTSRIISGLIGTFLSSHIDPRLSLGWQLQYLTTEGKWDVKNLEKWKAVKPVSLPIAKTFRAMKTLREVDERHSPKTFVQEYRGEIRAVVDISHDSPVYDPKGLEEGGIKYFKFPTISKLPPTDEEVQHFFEIIDQVQDEARGEGLIGVHCHYGFNRTGFFLVCYMVEKLGWRVEAAISAFEDARPPGIRHAHFIDALHVKYCVGLKKAPTL